MKKILLGLCLMGFSSVFADAIVGKDAPAFKLQGVDNKTYELSSMKGKIVVLEWTNYDCPFVKKHYDSKNMQTLQKKYTDRKDKAVVWLSVNSSAKDKQGNYSVKEWDDKIKSNGVAANTVLLDTDGTVGKLYGARTTPHMFIIDTKGVLAYAGAIDDKPTADPRDIPKAKNYVSAALEELLVSKPVTVKSSEPYGCSVKYGAPLASLHSRSFGF